MTMVIEYVNHFEVIGIPAAPWIDFLQLKKAFINKQKEVHPDTGDVTELSQDLNASYELLKRPEGSIKCFLLLHISEQELNQNALPNEFLMEMMELSDLIEESRNTQSESITAEAKNILNTMNEDLEKEKIAFSQMQVPPSFSDLQTLKVWYQKFRYYIRLCKNFEGIEEM